MVYPDPVPLLQAFECVAQLGHRVYIASRGSKVAQRGSRVGGHGGKLIGRGVDALRQRRASVPRFRQSEACWRERAEAVASEFERLNELVLAAPARSVEAKSAETASP